MACGGLGDRGADHLDGAASVAAGGLEERECRRDLVRFVEDGLFEIGRVGVAGLDDLALGAFGRGHLLRHRGVDLDDPLIALGGRERVLGTFHEIHGLAQHAFGQEIPEFADERGGEVHPLAGGEAVGNEIEHRVAIDAGLPLDLVHGSTSRSRARGGSGAWANPRDCHLTSWLRAIPPATL